MTTKKKRLLNHTERQTPCSHWPRVFYFILFFPLEMREETDWDSKHTRCLIEGQVKRASKLHANTAACYRFQPIAYIMASGLHKRQGGRWLGVPADCHMAFRSPGGKTKPWTPGSCLGLSWTCKLPAVFLGKPLPIRRHFSSCLPPCHCSATGN